MKKRVARKLTLNRETIHRLTDSSLSRAGGAFEDGDIGVVVVDKPTVVSITACTQVISDCLYCTTPLASCPRTMLSQCTCA